MKMDDLICREEALKVCDKYNGQGYVWSCIRGDIEKLPSVHPTQNNRVNSNNSLDTISRQEAVDALQKEINKGIPPFDNVMGSIRCGVRLARNIIEDLPSAQPDTCAYWDRESYICALHRPSSQSGQGGGLNQQE